MALNWIETTIGDQLTLQRGFDITKTQQTTGTVPVISSGGISSYHDTPMVKGPGVVLGRKGTVGTVFFINEDYWPHDTTLWVKDFKSNDRRFVYYFFLYFAKRLANLDVGTANPTLNRNHVHPIPILWPRINEQRKIVEILSTLDDKIALNSKMNATLGQITQTLFKSWFVDFDPVKAKAAGRQPEGMDAETAALFPSEFEENTSTFIPKGWRRGTINDIGIIQRYGVTPSDISPNTPYIGLEHMPRKSIALPEWGKASDVTSGKFAFNKGDILFGKLRPL